MAHDTGCLTFNTPSDPSAPPINGGGKDWTCYPCYSSPACGGSVSEGDEGGNYLIYMNFLVLTLTRRINLKLNTNIERHVFIINPARPET